MAPHSCIVGVAVLASLLVAQFSPAAGFYLPGVPPVAYKRSERVPLYVNKIESTHTQLSFNYYSLPFCAPDKIEEESENLGEVLAGDRLSSSLYELYARQNEFCKVLCRVEYTAAQGAEFADKIKDEYTVDWMLDNLPAAVRLYSEENPADVYYNREFPIGISSPASSMQYLYNHLRFTIMHNPTEDVSGTRIVGFEVEPFRYAGSHQPSAAAASRSRDSGVRNRVRAVCCTSTKEPGPPTRSWRLAMTACV